MVRLSHGHSMNAKGKSVKGKTKASKTKTTKTTKITKATSSKTKKMNPTKSIQNPFSNFSRFRGICIPVGLIPYFLYIGVTGTFSTFIIFYDFAQYNAENETEGDGNEYKKIVEFAFAIWLLFVSLFSNTEETKYGVILVPYTIFLCQYIRMFFYLYENYDAESQTSENYIEKRLVEFFPEADIGLFGLISGILHIVFLFTLYLPFRILRQIGALLLLLYQGVLIYFSLDIQDAFVKNVNEIQVQENPFSNSLNFLIIYASSVMLIFSGIVDDDSTPFGYFLRAATRSNVPFFSFDIF
jgi:hypothetical protein